VKVILLFLKTIRFSEWGDTKLFECIMVLFLADQRRIGYLHLTSLAAALGFVASYLALGYFVNDLSDLSADRKAGKDRGVLHLTKQGMLVTGLALWGVNILSLFFIRQHHAWLFITGVILSYLSMLGYSLPPLRLKERGLVGVITAAAGQRTLPVIVLASTIESIPTSVPLYLALLTVNGLRWILIHQVMDRENDGATRIRTYAVQESARKLRSLMICIIFPSEVALGLALTICFAGTPYFIPLAAYWLILPVFTLLWNRYYGPISFFSYDYVPAGNFLLLLLPLVLLLGYSVVNSTGWVVLATALAVKWSYLRWQTGKFAALVGLLGRMSMAKR
jgi:4-hydroxybenzoate polyprenyltransferase